MADTKNDIAWKKLFDDYRILEQIKEKGWLVLNSASINVEREARLMTKFDHSFQLPLLFKKEHLSILPISRGEYIIAPMKTFCQFYHNDKLGVTEISLPANLESLDYNNITSEAMAINCAYVSGIISDFTNETGLLPTVSGRMGSQCFGFSIAVSKEHNDFPFLNIHVSHSQIEIDGGYEGEHSLILIEAKNTISSDFLIRQLYYPYRLWNDRINKKVRPLFLTYTNGVYYLREYEFEDVNHYNSIRLIKEKKYKIKDKIPTVIDIHTIKELMNRVEIIAEPTTIPFPQADSFERIINLCEILNSRKDKTISREELSTNYEFIQKETFQLRQVDYYTNAAIYLGLVYKSKEERKAIFYALTESGERLFDLSLRERQLRFAELILSHSVFNQALKLYFETHKKLEKENIVPIMKECNLSNIDKESTFRRRASSIIAWVNWIVSLIET